ncbi:hypothetical protein GLAREA_12437 [Glarea lozoyensis ATCC 20868]|uniref:DUF6590 domain-containing protein n=1 Tax=Glarea lozoyensis (strain ATCC 20868 / MF5171) TaxID=1116229 RepID=S3DI16_GLAL2|nr:uncharacterized protein GLAREA_12437 [Glarea lozoyensis ATCC 20868]EPE31681.1 hypothetical protein GLAREA_12437 [Glarea lozoyensis ATCC 20868]
MTDYVQQANGAKRDGIFDDMKMSGSKAKVLRRPNMAGSYSSSNVPRSYTSSSKRSSSKTPHRRESVSYSSSHQPRRDSKWDSRQAYPTAGSSGKERQSSSYHTQGGYGNPQGQSSSYDYAQPVAAGYHGGPATSNQPSQGYSMSGPSSPSDLPSGVSMAAQMNSMTLNEPTTTKYTVSTGYGTATTNPSFQNQTSYPSVGYSYDKTSNAPNMSQQYSSNYGGQSGGDMHSMPQTDHRTSQSPAHRYVAGTSGDREKLDSRYKVRNQDYKKFFQAGRVFSTLWTVPASGMTNNNETFTSYVKYGEKVHTKIRRFVVVKQRARSCTCLPVTSYEGKGFKKPEIDISEHGPIYSSKRPRSVPEITKKALKVILSKNADPLKDPSLINYGCMYTVETNVKVMDVGLLDRDSLELLLDYYEEVNYPRETDVNPHKDASDLAGVGTAFASGSQTYDADTRGGYSSPSMHDRTSSFGSQPSGYGGDTYRVPIAGSSTGYGTQATDTAGYTPPIVSDSRYTTSPSSPLENRYQSTAIPSTSTYSSTEGSSSNARFSPRSDASRDPENYTTQPPYPSSSYHGDEPSTSQYTPNPYPADEDVDSDPNPTPREETYKSTSSSHIGESSCSSTPYSSSTARAGESAYPSTAQARYSSSTASAPYSTPAADTTSYHPPTADDYTYRSSAPVFDEDDGGEITLPTREEAEAARPRKHRDSVRRREDPREREHHSRRERERERRKR